MFNFEKNTKTCERLNALDAIVSQIVGSGFEVTRQLETQLTREQAEEFYAMKKSEPFYEDLIQEMIRYAK